MNKKNVAFLTQPDAPPARRMPNAALHRYRTKLLVVLLCAFLMKAATRPASGANDVENLAYPAEIAAWDDAEKDRQRQQAREMVARFEAAVAAGQRHFRVPPGHYRFADGLGDWRIEDVCDMTIEGRGATLWFRAPCGIKIDGCRNVVLREFTLDYDPLTFSQGRIVAFHPEKNRVDIRIDPGFPGLMAPRFLRGSPKAMFYNDDRQQIETRMDWVDIQTVEPIGPREFRVGLKHGWIYAYQSEVKLGDRLVLPIRWQHAVKTSHSATCTFEELTFYATPSYAFHEHEGEGGHTYRKCRVVRRPDTERLIACTADVFHSVGVVHGPTIEGCEFEHAGDDFVNIHNRMWIILEVRSPQELVLATPFPVDTPPAAGAPLRFYELNTLKPLGPAAAVRVKRLEDPELQAKAASVPADGQERRAGTRLCHLHNPSVFLVELDRPTTAQRLDLMTREDNNARGTVIRNNHFRDGFSRGILLKCQGALVEGNRLERIGSTAIGINVAQYWLEGPFPRDITVRNNTLMYIGTMLQHRRTASEQRGAISVLSRASDELVRSIHVTNVRIEGNHIVRPTNCGVFLANARDCAILNNTIESPVSEPPVGNKGLLPGFAAARHAIYVDAVQNVAIAGNRIVDMGEHCRGDVGVGPHAVDVRVSRPDAADNGRVPKGLGYCFFPGGHFLGSQVGAPRHPGREPVARHVDPRELLRGLGPQ